MKKLVEESLNETGHNPKDLNMSKMMSLKLQEIQKYCELAITDAEETLEHYLGVEDEHDDEVIIEERGKLDGIISVAKDILEIIKNK